MITAGRVTVDGRVVRDPLRLVHPDRARLVVDGHRIARAAWRTILLNKPRGTVTTRRDPEGRPTVFDGLGAEAAGLVAVGRLDLATTGLLLLTTDTGLANWLADPASRIVRRYVATVRGRLSDDSAAAMTHGVKMKKGGDRLRAAAVTIRKRSSRESQVIIDLDEGRNREIRRLCEALGHEVTRLKRVAFGGLELGALRPGEWRTVTRADLVRAFGPGAAAAR